MKFGNQTMIRKYCEMLKNHWERDTYACQVVKLIIGDLREFGIDWYDCISKFQII